MLRIGLNGFGRIGRILTRIAYERDDMQVVAINSRASAESHAHLLTYDSTYGTWKKDITHDEDSISIDGDKIHVGMYNSPADIPRDQWNVDVVVDATGKFKDKASLLGHLKGSVKKVVLSAPGKWLDTTLVLWVNEDTYDSAHHHILSNASCTTNGLWPVVKLLQDTVGIEHAFFTTVHAVTSSQNILDNSHKKNLRIARSHTESIIPTSTWASKAITKIMPELSGKIQWCALRVPTATVSYIDLVVQTLQAITEQSIQEVFANNPSPYIHISHAPLVSVDLRGSSYSSIVDMPLTQIQEDYLVKLGIWYDNEWWYACRVADLVKLVW